MKTEINYLDWLDLAYDIFPLENIQHLQEIRWKRLLNIHSTWAAPMDIRHIMMKNELSLLRQGKIQIKHIKARLN